MLRIRLIGAPAIEASNGERREVRGKKPWALLARVVLADRPLTRRELSAELFADAADPLGSLRWCLASLRKAIGSAEVLTGDPIRPELPEWVSIDVHELQQGRLDPAPLGELLEGVDPPCGPEFATWLLVSRQQIAARVAAELREATIAALSRHDHDGALKLAELAARRAPYDEGPQVLLARALAAAGHAEAALEHVHAVEARFREELGCDPSPVLRSAARAGVEAAPLGVSSEALALSLLRSGQAALAAGAIEAGLDSLRRAGAAAGSSHVPALHGQCLLELGSALVHAVRGFDDEGSVLLEEATQLAKTAGDRATAVAATRERAYVDTLAGRRDDAQRRLSAAFELAAGEPELLPGLHAVSGLNLADWGRHDDALVHYESAVECARISADPQWEAWTLGIGGWHAFRDGRHGLAERWLRECLDAVREMRWLSFEPWPLAALAELHLAADGASAGSLEELERIFAASCQLEDPCWEGASGRVLALHHARAGRSDAALRWIGDARRRARRRSDTWVGMIGAILMTEAQISWSAGDHQAANALARELVAFAASTQLDRLLDEALDLARAST